jgi:hypothetical protein
VYRKFSAEITLLGNLIGNWIWRERVPANFFWKRFLKKLTVDKLSESLDYIMLGFLVRNKKPKIQKYPKPEILSAPYISDK